MHYILKQNFWTRLQENHAKQSEVVIGSKKSFAFMTRSLDQAYVCGLNTKSWVFFCVCVDTQNSRRFQCMEILNKQKEKKGNI